MYRNYISYRNITLFDKILFTKTDRPEVKIKCKTEDLP